MRPETEKSTYLEKLQGEVDATDFGSLTHFSDKLDYLLKSVYLLFERHQEHLRAHSDCPECDRSRKQRLEKLHLELEAELRQLTRRVHDFSLNHFRIPFYHDQVILAAKAEYGREGGCTEG